MRKSKNSGRIVRGLAVLLALVAGHAGFAISTLQLKNGNSIKGEIISERTDKVIVDLGFTVLSIPADEIDKILKDDATRPAGVVETSDLYRVEPNPTQLTVKENVDRCAEAVVLIRTPTGLGSGFIINKDGYVLTNEHVVAGEYKISVTRFRRGSNALDRIQYNNVRIVALDSTLDLALLKIDDAGATDLPTLPLGDSALMTEGQPVFAIGSPLGLERTVSQGIISQQNRLMGGQLYLQTTTQINPGNSGGPLFNLRGEIVGVNNMKAHAVGVEGLNFAIPTTVVKTFLRNRSAFAFDPRNPNAGFRYIEPPRLKFKK